MIFDNEWAILHMWYPHFYNKEEQKVEQPQNQAVIGQSRMDEESAWINARLSQESARKEPSSNV